MPRGLSEHRRLATVLVVAECGPERREMHALADVGNPHAYLLSAPDDRRPVTWPQAGTRVRLVWLQDAPDLATEGRITLARGARCVVEVGDHEVGSEVAGHVVARRSQLRVPLVTPVEILRPTYRHGWTTDLGAGGCRIVVAPPVPPIPTGAPLRLRLGLDERFGIAIIPSELRTAWTPEAGGFSAGIEFTDLDATTRAAITALVAEHVLGA
jgi:hypothetical protein